MSPGGCATHPYSAAAYRCESCGKLLCDKCIKEGHRLLFCVLCGERAMPLAEDRPASTPDLKRHRAIAAPYSMTDALGYCLRGKGAAVFWSYVVALSVLDIIPFGFVFMLLIYLLLPGFLFEIARTTAEGRTELPDWPDYLELGERFREIFSILLAAALALSPILALAYVTGVGSNIAASLFAIFLGSLLAAPIWVAAFGSTGVYSSTWLTFRLDLHVRAFLAGGTDFLLTAALIYVGLVFSPVVEAIAASYVILGFVVSNIINIYTSLTGAHMIGLLFRRHSATMETIYLGTSQS